MAETTSGGGAKRARRTRRRTAGTGGAKQETETKSSGSDAEKELPSVSASAGAHGAAGSSRVGRVRQRDATQFLRQLIMMLEAGTPLLRTLERLSDRASRSAPRALISDIAEYVESGNAFWQACERHPRVFSTVEVNLIRAAEASGNLNVILGQLADYRERRAMLAKKVRAAMIYPVVLIAACFVVALILANVVVPEFLSLFERLDVEPGAFSDATISAIVWFGDWWWAIVGVTAAVVVLGWLWGSMSPVNRLRLHRWSLRIPIIGSILQKYAVVQMTRTWALLLRSGLSMMVALDLTRNAIHNQAVAQTLQAVRDNVEAGGSIEDPLRRYPKVIPGVVTDMLVTGEETGQLDEIAERVANNYEEDVNVEVTTLGETLQPVLTIIIGVFVALLFVALFLPMISMLEQLNTSAGA